jgi:uncharacterized protein (UPF0179 family)
MAEQKRIITMVGERQARPKFAFFYSGPSQACRVCSYFKVCQEKLEQGCVYEIVKVRDKEIPCNVHEEKARVVEVVEADLSVAVSKRETFEGATVTIKSSDCENKSCPSFSICVPSGLKKRGKYRIVGVSGPISCPLRRALVEVQVRRVP